MVVFLSCFLLLILSFYNYNYDSYIIPNSTGSVRELCPLAPNNVNTMASAALAANTLGFDRVQARLVAKKGLTAHVVTIELEGIKGEGEEDVFRVATTRYNPAKMGAVTGNLTYSSFLSSLLNAGGRGNGVHFC